MLIAKHADGTTIRFSRLEHALLLCLARNPHKLVTRAELLAAMSSKGDALSERKVDYLVNRLRRRLGDTAKESRFIATKYGGGYVWVADANKRKPYSAFLLIGPTFATNDEPDATDDFPQRLASGIQDALGDEKNILICPEWRPDPQISDNLEFTLDIDSHVEGDVTHLALVLRKGKSQRTIERFRKTCPNEHSEECVNNLSRSIVYSMWRHATLFEPGVEALVMNAAGAIDWHHTQAIASRCPNPEQKGPELPVLLALNKYETLVNSIHNAPLSEDEWDSLETEIENISLRALPDVEGNPDLLMAIAKMLRFIDRGYLELSGRLTNEAFSKSTAFTKVFSMKGKIATSKGDITAALSYYDKAMRMIEYGSRAHVHLLIFKFMALKAEDNRTAAHQTVLDLHSIAPLDQNLFGLLLLPMEAKQLCASSEDKLAALTPETGQHLCRYLFRAWARQFQRDDHRQKIMRGLIHHIQRRHGRSFICSDVIKRFPNLLLPENT